MKTVRFAAVAAVLTSTAVGLATPASAELTDGQYEKTYLSDGRTITVIFTSCGPSCKRQENLDSAVAVEYHLEGNTWISPAGSASVQTIDNDSLTGAFHTGELSSGDFKLVKVG